MKIKFKNTISVLIKRLFNFFELVLVLLILFIYLLRSYEVQSFIAHEFTDYLKTQLDSDIRLNKVKVKSFKNFEINEILIPDLNGDTIVFIPKLKLDLDQVKLIGNKYVIDEILLKDAIVNLRKKKGSSHYDHEFLIKGLANKDEGSGGSFIFQINSLKLDNCAFMHLDLNDSIFSEKFDYQNFKLNKLNGLFNSFVLTENYFISKVNHLSFNETKGFLLNELNGKIIIDSSKINVSDLTILTNKSKITLDDFDYYTNKDSIKNDSLRYSLIALKTDVDFTDLNHFIKLPFKTNSKVKLFSNLEVGMNNAVANNLELKIGDKSFLDGKLIVENYSHTQDLKFDFHVSDAEFFMNDIEEILLLKKDETYEPITIPSNFQAINNISLEISGNGCLNDLSTDFSISTDLGSVFGKLKLKENEANHLSYNLQIDAIDFQGKLISENNNIDRFNAHMNIDGFTTDSNDIDLEMLGKLSDVKIAGRKYEDVNIKGKLNNQSFDGQVQLIDKSLEALFLGSIDLNSFPYKFDFSFNVDHANLHDLGLLEAHPNSDLSFTSKANGQGTTFDNFSGFINMNDVVFKENNEKYFFDSLNFFSYSSPLEHHLNLKSKFLSFDLTGNYHLENLLIDLQSFLSLFVPKVFNYNSNNLLKDEDVHLMLDFHDVTLLTKLFFPELHISNGSIIDLSFSKEQKIAELFISSGFLSYDNYELNDLEIDSYGNKSFSDSILNVLVSVSSFKDGNLIDFENIVLNSHANQNQVNLTLGWAQNDSSSKGDFEISSYLHNFDSIEFYLNKGILSSATGDWIWTDTSNLLLNKNKFSLDKMSIVNAGQEVYLKGNIGPLETDVFSIYFNELGFKNISNILNFNNDNFKINGAVNGSVELSSLSKNASFVSELSLNDIKINDYMIGDFNFNSVWEKTADRFRLYGGLLNESRVEEILFEDLFYYPYSMSKNELYGKFLFNQFNIDFISPFLPNDFLSDLDGEISGQLRLSGALENPILKGILKLNQGAIKLTEFNTEFQMNGVIQVDPNNIEIIGAEFLDKNNTKGSLSVFYNHDNFSSYSFNIITQFNEPFLVMNNSYENNPNYYGDAFVTGFANVSYDSISGYSVNVNAKTENNTSLTIPLYGSDEVVLHDFISFKSSDTAQVFDLDNKIYYDEDFNLNIDLDITEDAELQLVFDEMVGDVMKSKGSGNIRLSLDKHFDLSMFGNYTVSEGSYSFTLKDFINKKFKIEPGGQITWYGNPYNAHLDLFANYSLRTSLYNIMPLIEQQNWTHKSEVDVKIHLMNDLLNPDVGFGIELPKASESAKTSLKSLVTNEEEMNKQVFSLLILNKFIPQHPEVYSDNSNKINGASTTEALGNQLGNMISSFTEDFEVGFNYSVGDLISNNELSLAMSTQQFNNRLKINTNLGMSQANELNKNPSSFIGDVDVEYKVNPRGNLRLHVFNESNEFDLSNQNQANYTQGIGAFYRQSFTSTAELLCEMSNLFKSKKNKCKDCSDPKERNK